MYKHGRFEVYTFEEVKDELYGKIGTPKRDEYEAEVAEMLRALQLGEAIKISNLPKLYKKKLRKKSHISMRQYRRK